MRRGGPEQAGRRLDDAGLTKRDCDSFRTFPDGSNLAEIWARHGWEGVVRLLPDGDAANVVQTSLPTNNDLRNVPPSSRSPTPTGEVIWLRP